MGRNGRTANHGMNEVTHEATQQALDEIKEILGEYKGHRVGCPFCGTEYKLQKHDDYSQTLREVQTLTKDFQAHKCPHCDKKGPELAKKYIPYTFQFDGLTIEVLKLSIFAR